ncbi:MAG: hypothetical protein ACOYOQ_15380 [Microthrixaceae bacterium]
MAQEPIDESHAAQILAGTVGRDYGHSFEEHLASELRLLGTQPFRPQGRYRHLTEGWPGVEVLAFIAHSRALSTIEQVDAWWVGGLATGAGGIRVIPGLDVAVPRSKSDVIIRIVHSVGTEEYLGVGVKTCNAAKPTNAQLYFTTASAFSALMRDHDLPLGTEGETALKMFCGDPGLRPVDQGAVDKRLADPDRWFWEELPSQGRAELENLFTDRQDDVTRVLLSYAYIDDPLPPTYILHQRFRASDESQVPMAIYSVDQFVEYSSAHGGFSTREYTVNKGRYKNDPGIHLAPRFGFVQMQRGGQAQHPTQLQFNLKAGYFGHAPDHP